MGETLIPSGNNERIAWSINFESKFPQLAPDLGFSSAEVTALVQDAVVMRLRRNPKTNHRLNQNREKKTSETGVF